MNHNLPVLYNKPFGSSYSVGKGWCDKYASLLHDGIHYNSKKLFTLQAERREHCFNIITGNSAVNYADVKEP